MPIYEYGCNQCDYKIETLQSFGEGFDSFPCPRDNCEGTVEKLVSGFAFTGATKKSRGNSQVETDRCERCGVEKPIGWEHVATLVEYKIAKKK